MHLLFTLSKPQLKYICYFCIFVFMKNTTLTHRLACLFLDVDKFVNVIYWVIVISLWIYVQCCLQMGCPHLYAHQLYVRACILGVGRRTGVWTQGFKLANQCPLQPTSSPFCSVYFGDGISRTICPGWPWTQILSLPTGYQWVDYRSEPPASGWVWIF
jgi:hypothetical protein